MSTLDNLERLYESLDTELDFQALVSESRSEDNFLEFKQKHDRRTADIQVDDKKNNSKSLASFSSAEGGIVIWGIRAKSIDGRDCATELKPISDAEAFAEKLRIQLLTTLRPSNSRIRIHAVANEKGVGYVKVLIPAGDSPPYQANDYHKTYFQRADGRTLPMEDFQIRDAMSRRSKPNLDLLLESKFTPNTDMSVCLELSVFLHNQGQVLAKYSGWVMFVDDTEVISIETCIDETSRNTQTVIRFDSTNGSVIHPNNMRVYTGKITLRPKNNDTPVLGHIRWYAEGVAAKRWDFIIPCTPINSTHIWTNP